MVASGEDRGDLPSLSKILQLFKCELMNVLSVQEIEKLNIFK